MAKSFDDRSLREFFLGRESTRAPSLDKEGLLLTKKMLDFLQKHDKESFEISFELIARDVDDHERAFSSRDWRFFADGELLSQISPIVKDYISRFGLPAVFSEEVRDGAHFELSHDSHRLEKTPLTEDLEAKAFEVALLYFYERCFWPRHFKDDRDFFFFKAQDEGQYAKIKLEFIVKKELLEQTLISAFQQKSYRARAKKRERVL